MSGTNLNSVAKAFLRLVCRAKELDIYGVLLSRYEGPLISNGNSQLTIIKKRQLDGGVQSELHFSIVSRWQQASTKQNSISHLVRSMHSSLLFPNPFTCPNLFDPRGDHELASL